MKPALRPRTDAASPLKLAPWRPPAWLSLFSGAAWTLAAAGARADEPEDPGPPVHAIVESPRPVMLGEHVRGKQAPQIWTIPATLPPVGGVALTLHGRSRFEVYGPGVAATDFELDDTRPVRLTLLPGSRRNNILGSVMGIVSTVIVPIAAITFTVGLLTARNDNEVGPPGWLSSGNQVVLGAGLVLGVGVAGVISGWTLYGLSQTRVRKSPG